MRGTIACKGEVEGESDDEVDGEETEEVSAWTRFGDVGFEVVVLIGIDHHFLNFSYKIKS